jgi:hypothetical protein
MKTNLFGITNIKIKHFSIVDNDYSIINRFLKEYDGSIIDIQYSQNNFTAKQVLIIYQDYKNKRGI